MEEALKMERERERESRVLEERESFREREIFGIGIEEEEGSTSLTQ